MLAAPRTQPRARVCRQYPAQTAGASLANTSDVVHGPAGPSRNTVACVHAETDIYLDVDMDVHVGFGAGGLTELIATPDGQRLCRMWGPLSSSPLTRKREPAPGNSCCA